jgi:hypothetical protein
MTKLPYDAIVLSLFFNSTQIVQRLPTYSPEPLLFLSQAISQPRETDNTSAVGQMLQQV